MGRRPILKLAVVFLLAGPAPCFGSDTADAMTVQPFDKTAVPMEIRHKGRIVDGARWTDRNGENILLLTETGAFRSPTNGEPEEDDFRDAELYAYHFVRNQKDWSLLWQIKDFERDCQLDLTFGFLPGLFVTDLDSNGIAETTFLYRVSCNSDVSPVVQKLIMHEGTQKYAVRGHNRPAPAFGGDGGDRALDPSLKKAKAAFKAFAIKKWDEYVDRPSPIK